MLTRIWDNRETIIVGVAAAGVIYFLDNIHSTLTADHAQMATIIEAIDELETTQGKILGRLDGDGTILYEIGVRDGRALCAQQ